ncbi:nuclear transport factor 2 family protein [Pseudonocardia hispaniensis]|uniref:Nuclear transport factor 2 family protein n=1 Tax=Pseudonocardia hispaniensis TaxID=904933 RepID=A0ABW1J6N2_9PSEU
MSSLLLPSTATGATTYGYLIDMVERYFDAVDKYDLDGVLSCFNEEAVVTIQTAHSVHSGRDDDVRQMYIELFDNYKRNMRHIHFRHVVDPDNNRIASQFEVELTDNDGNQITLTNCNFFYLENGRFSRVYIYMSDGMNVLN